jgi:hypothetical protein
MRFFNPVVFVSPWPSFALRAFVDHVAPNLNTYSIFARSVRIYVPIIGKLCIVRENTRGTSQLLDEGPSFETSKFTLCFSGSCIPINPTLFVKPSNTIYLQMLVWLLATASPNHPFTVTFLRWLFSLGLPLRKIRFELDTLLNAHLSDSHFSALTKYDTAFCLCCMRATV